MSALSSIETVPSARAAAGRAEIFPSVRMLHLFFEKVGGRRGGILALAALILTLLVPVSAHALNGRVVKVSDGDSLTVQTADGQT